MKKLLYAVFVFSFVISAQSCKKEKKLITIPVNMNFTTPYATPHFDVLDTLYEVETFRFETGIDAYLIPKNSAKNLLQDIYLDEMQMKIVLNDTTSFDMLKTIDVFIQADGLPPTLGASLHEVPKTGLKTIDLKPSGKNLKEYLKKDEIYLVIKFVLREELPENTIMSIKTKYSGKAGVL